MLVSPFAFYRVGALIMVADLARNRHSGVAAQLCGDAHLSNFGVFGSPERNLVFDINDFDETAPGPWKWDVKRLAASLAIAGRENGFSRSSAKVVVLETMRSYREAMTAFAGMRTLEVWYSRLPVKRIFKREFAAGIDPTRVKRTEADIAKSRTKGLLDAVSTQRLHTCRVPEVRANGVSLYYEEHGAGTPIVCIHGTGGSAAIWGDAATELATLGRAIVYDRRGCFRSERPEPYVTNVHEHADDAAALIDALEAAPAIVIGRSYGGQTAIDLALRYADRVRALVLLEASLLSLSDAGMRWAETIKDRVFAAAHIDVGTVAETFLRSVLGDATWEGFPEPAKQMFIANGPAIVAELRGGFLEVGTEKLRTVAQPTLLVAGMDSPPAFAEVTNIMAEAIPEAKIECIEGGHLVNAADPAVLRFVEQMLAAR